MSVKTVDNTSINILLIKIGQDSLNANNESQQAVMEGVNAKNAEYQRLNEKASDDAQQLTKKHHKKAGFTDNGFANCVISVGISTLIIGATVGAMYATGGAGAIVAGTGMLGGGLSIVSVLNSGVFGAQGAFFNGFQAKGEILAAPSASTISKISQDLTSDQNQITQLQSDINSDMQVKVGTMQNMNETIQNMIQQQQKNQQNLVRSNNG